LSVKVIVAGVAVVFDVMVKAPVSVLLANMAVAMLPANTDALTAALPDQ
jgi:hypothetical protein